MTNKLVIIVSLLFLVNVTFSQTIIKGKWKNLETGSIVEIYNQNELFFGKIVKVSGANSKEKVGHLLLTNLAYQESSKNYLGQINSTNGMTASCKIELLNPNQFRLTVSRLFFKRTQLFVKEKNRR